MIKCLLHITVCYTRDSASVSFEKAVELAFCPRKGDSFLLPTIWGEIEATVEWADYVLSESAWRIGFADHELYGDESFCGFQESFEADGWYVEWQECVDMPPQTGEDRKESCISRSVTPEQDAANPKV